LKWNSVELEADKNRATH